MKGQAFDTFKLLIAAVVAIAILGILLSILSGLIIPGAEPPTMIREQLSKAYQFPESSFVSQAKASFRSGSSFSPNSFKDAMGSTGELTFACSDSLGDACDDDSGSVLKINSDFSAYVGACCVGPACQISILVEDESAGCP